MAKKDMPFDDDVMTMIMGIGGPDEPGQHGRKNEPGPDKSALDALIEIRDLAEDAIKKFGKEDEGEDKKDKDVEEDVEIDMEEE